MELLMTPDDANIGTFIPNFPDYAVVLEENGKKSYFQLDGWAPNPFGTFGIDKLLSDYKVPPYSKVKELALKDGISLSEETFEACKKGLVRSKELKSKSYRIHTF